MKFKRSKFSRQRGNSSHGWGAKKKHRGAGHRGGRGNAGSGKRADQKKPSNWKTDYFGKFGFASHGQEKIKAISIMSLESGINGMISRGEAKLEGGFYTIDLGSLGYQKLVSKGKVTRKFKIKVASATEGAAEKIKAVGGTIE
jgi:large subunit ribosomal protein L15